MPTNFREEQYTVIGQGSELEGVLRIEGDVFVFGKVNGEVHAPGAHVNVEKHAIIRGKIVAQNVTIMGEFDGQLEATATLKCGATSEIRGTISCQKIQIEPGAILDIEGHAQGDLQ